MCMHVERGQLHVIHVTGVCTEEHVHRGERLCEHVCMGMGQNDGACTCLGACTQARECMHTL